MNQENTSLKNKKTDCKKKCSQTFLIRFPDVDPIF